MNVRGRLLAALLAVAASPAVALAQDHGAEGGGNSLFSINPGLSIWTVIVFLILLFILLFGGMKNMLYVCCAQLSVLTRFVCVCCYRT